MIRTKNLSPFLFGYRVCSRNPPKPEMTAIVRAKFVLKPGEPVTPMRVALMPMELEEDERVAETDALIDQSELLLGQGNLTADVYLDSDDARTGHVVYPSDFAEFKLNAEVMLTGSCHSKRATAQTSVRFEVGDWEKVLAVTGKRVWVDRVLGGKHTDPLGFTSMPLDYGHAYGGAGFAANPRGIGHESDDLPNVEDPQHLVTSSGQEPLPAGFGAINPEWPQRKAKVGKEYGDDYEKNYEPWYPRDFDWTYLHAAPPDQQLKGYLQGGEKLRFCGMHPEVADFRTEVPKYRPRVFVQLVGGEQIEFSLKLDTLLADLDEGALYLTWRGLAPVAEDDLSDVVCALVVCEDGSEPAKPAAEYLEVLGKYHDDPIGLQDENSQLGQLQKMHDKIESRELQAEVDAVPEDDNVMVNIFDKVLAPVFPPEQLALMKDKVGSTLDGVTEKSPDVPRKIKDEVIKALDESLDPISPGIGIGKDGEVKGSVAPLIKRTLKPIAKAQKQAEDAGLDQSEVDAAFKEAFAKIEDDNLREALGDVDMAKLREMAEEIEPAPDKDCSGQDYSDRDLSGMDLHGINLEGATLVRANLSGCNLEGAKLSAAALSSANLNGASLKGADLSVTVLSRTQCVETDFSGANMDRTMIVRCDFTRAKLVGIAGEAFMSSKGVFRETDFEGSTFFTAAFDGCDMEGAKLEKCTFERSLFRQCKLMNAQFNYSKLVNCGFLESDLSQARFFQAHGKLNNWLKAVIKDADFSYCAFPENMFMNVDGRRANFYAADMPDVRFYKAGLREAIFEKANLFQADMRKTALTQTNFRGANLYLAQFIEAFGTDADFTKANIKMANFKRNQLVRKGA